MARMSLMPVPPEQTGATCPHCSAPIVADQRYCLTCGQPCAPVRLAFLDVLQSEQRAPAGSRLGVRGSAREGRRRAVRATPLAASILPARSALLAVLLLAILVGLLVGHWVTQGNGTPGKQVVEVKGLPTVAAAAPSAPSPRARPRRRRGKPVEFEPKKPKKQRKPRRKKRSRPTAPSKTVKVQPVRRSRNCKHHRQTAPGRTERDRRSADRNRRLRVAELRNPPEPPPSGEAAVIPAGDPRILAGSVAELRRRRLSSQSGWRRSHGTSAVSPTRWRSATTTAWM